MADDVKDIAIYTGSEWTSLSELAAGTIDVDAKLPIESVDGTVTLQSPETNKYQIVVGGASRVDVGTSDITFRDPLVFSEWRSKGDSPSYIQHHTSSTHIEFEGTEKANSKSYFSVFLSHGIDHWGRYEDEFENMNGKWVFVYRRVKTDGWIPDGWAAKRLEGKN